MRKINIKYIFNNVMIIAGKIEDNVIYGYRI